MLFNSLAFAAFLTVVFTLYWGVFAKAIRARNVFILIASYVFYGAWDWRFLLLIAFSTAVDYVAALAMEKSTSPKRRKGLLAVSLIVNIGLLAYFKYAGFFVESFAAVIEMISGYRPPELTLNIILPVGISFYTFQTLSYTIDVYRGKISATKDFVKFAAFVAFFPQLVAGPIELAANLLPQFDEKKKFTYQMGSTGMRLIVWGLFKKMVIADNCAPYVNEIFANHAELPSAVLAMGAVLFAFQIYCDFSGYSDIAIGTARLLGFDLTVNFRYPYFSSDMAEFWRRWHISLSTWFRDYVYIPLGGSRRSVSHIYKNLLVIFLVSGLRHGADWTFVAWGLFHGLFLIIERLGFKSILNRLPNALQWFYTILVVMVGWVLFRVEALPDAIAYIVKLFSFEQMNNNSFLYYLNNEKIIVLLLAVVSSSLFFVKIKAYLDKRNYFQTIAVQTALDIGFVILLLICIVYINSGSYSPFIYFRF